MKLDPALIARTKGFLNEVEGQMLFELAQEASGHGPCLEVGSYCGKSALYLGAGCHENNGTLFSVDDHRGSEEQQPGEEYFDPELFDCQSQSMNSFPFFRRALVSAGLEQTVVPIVARSAVAAKAWATPLALVFIDGGHALETVSSDYAGWSSHVIAGGYLIFHDIYRHPEEGGQAPYTVYRAALDSQLYRELPAVGSLGVLQRIEPASLSAGILRHGERENLNH